MRIYHYGQLELVASVAVLGVDAGNVIWSPDDGVIVLWDSVVSCRIVAFDCMLNPLKTWESDSATSLPIRTCAFTDDSKMLVTGSCDDKVRVFNALLLTLIIEIDLFQCAIKGVTEFYREEQRRSEKGTASLIRAVDSLKLK